MAAKKITNLKDKLYARLPFGDVWLVKDEKDTPVSEVGYIRADHDGNRWWNTVWPMHDDLRTSEICAEIDEVYDAFMRSFKDLGALRKWCYANARQVSDTEYNAYYIGEHGCYWLRLITRFRDYNLYLHCYSKASMKSLNIDVQ